MILSWLDSFALFCCKDGFTIVVHTNWKATAAGADFLKYKPLHDNIMQNSKRPGKMRQVSLKLMWHLKY